MPEQVTDKTTRATDYRLNQLGVRVDRSTCQLISRIGKEWLPIGPRWQLPISVPEDDAHAAYAHALSVTAYQFCKANPDTDLLYVLTHGHSAERLPRPSSPFRFDIIERLMSRGRAAPYAGSGDLIAASRALIRSSRELLGPRNGETA